MREHVPERGRTERPSLVVPAVVWTELTELIHSERPGGVLLAGHSADRYGLRLLGRELITPAPGEYDPVTGTFASAFLESAARQARADGNEFYPLVVHGGPGIPAYRMLLGDDNPRAGGLALRPGPEPGTVAEIIGEVSDRGEVDPIDEIVVPGTTLLRLRATSSGGRPQDRYARLRVGVIGLGPLGLDLLDALAGLGVGEFALIDPGTVAADEAAIRRTALAGDRIRRIDPGAGVLELPMRARDHTAATVHQSCDWVFLTTGNDLDRWAVTDTLTRFLVPATEIEIVAGTGQVVALTPGGGCLHCIGRIDRDRAKAELDAIARRTKQRPGSPQPPRSGLSPDPEVTAAADQEASTRAFRALVIAEAVAHFALSVFGRHTIDRPGFTITYHSGTGERVLREHGAGEKCTLCRIDGFLGYGDC